MSSIARHSRWLIVIAVVGCLAGALIALGTGLVEVVALGGRTLAHEATARDVSHVLVEATDLFLLGVVMYVVALGLTALFLDANLALPPWLIVRSLDDLKGKLLGVVTLTLVVTFLGHLSEWRGGRDLLYVGGGIGAVLIGLAWGRTGRESKGAA